MEKHKLLYPIIIGISIAVGILLANLYYQQAEQTTGFAIPKKVQGNKFDEIMYLLDNNYVDVIDKNALTEEFIPQILKFLDPHSAYLTPEEVAESATELQGSFSGIGVQFNIQNDTVMIVSVIPGGPSEKLGILPGDRIIAVNDSSFVGADVTNATVLKTLRGEKGSIVKVRIKRNESPLPLDFDIVRGDVPVKSIDVVYVIADSTGYVKISNFGANTYREFLDALVILREQECNNIIVDLRNNSGGYLSAVIQMTNEFLKRGQLIVYTEGVNQAREDAIADGRGNFRKENICVLINEWSASASEIFAGAIQDHDRGWVIGRRSFGKGLVQQQIPLSDGSELRLTVARYHTPSGRSIQKPYKSGESDENYDVEIEKRVLHGEMFQKDSISFADSLKYYTAKGRTVYANGGIMPDIFVPHDTTYYTPYYTNVLNNGIVYDFSFAFVDKHRAKLSTYDTWEKLVEYLVKKTTYFSEFIRYAEQKGVSRNSQEIAKSKALLANLLQAYIARNLLGDEAFYPILNLQDNTVKKAIEMVGKPIQ